MKSAETHRQEHTHALPAMADDGPHGECHRQRQTMGTWRKQYLRLTGKSLNVHSSASDRKPRPSSIYDCAGCTIEKGSEPFTFTKDKPTIVLKRADLADGEFVAAFDSEYLRDCFFDALLKLDGVTEPGSAVSGGGGGGGESSPADALLLLLALREGQENAKRFFMSVRAHFRRVLTVLSRLPSHRARTAPLSTPKRIQCDLKTLL